MSKLISYNPADGSVNGEVEQTTQQGIDQTLEKAKKAFVSWRRLSIAERIAYVKKVRELLAKNKEEFAELTTKEMGKPIVEARDDVDFELGFIDWYIDNAQKSLEDVVVQDDEKATYKVVYEPWGVCASIAPWNFPVSMASSGIMQQILAGNTVIFKPSEYTTLTQKRFVDLFAEAEFPEGVVQGVYGDGEVGKMLIDGDIDLLWFTGSTAVGQELYRKCGEKFIKGIMELGGSSPAIVFADCDLENALDQLYSARFYNCRQVCSAVKRLFVEKPIFEKVVEGLKKRIEKQKIGKPMKEDTTVGPLVSKEQLDLLVSQVEDAKKKGVTVITGGSRPEGREFEKGNYFLPTLLTNITKDMRVITEEVFGPVLPVMPFETEEEVIALANNTPYGLTSEVFTKDSARAERVARSIESGVVGINTDSFYVPFAPIGGYKRSGMGREYGAEGFRELTQIKYICVKK